jgi:hypothetical protein
VKPTLKVEAPEPELSDPMLLLLSELHSSARHFFLTGSPANTPLDTLMPMKRDAYSLRLRRRGSVS